MFSSRVVRASLLGAGLMVVSFGTVRSSQEGTIESTQPILTENFIRPCTVTYIWSGMVHVTGSSVAKTCSPDHIETDSRVENRNAANLAGLRVTVAASDSSWHPLFWRHASRHPGCEQPGREEGDLAPWRAGCRRRSHERDAGLPRGECGEGGTASPLSGSARGGIEAVRAAEPGLSSPSRARAEGLRLTTDCAETGLYRPSTGRAACCREA